MQPSMSPEQFGQDDEEFLSAIAADFVVTTDRVDNADGNFSQDGVSDLVADRQSHSCRHRDWPRTGAEDTVETGGSNHLYRQPRADQAAAGGYFAKKRGRIVVLHPDKVIDS